MTTGPIGDPRKFPFPPAIPAAALLVAWALDHVWPLGVVWPAWSRPVGWVLFTVPHLFAFWAIRVFRQHRTVLNPRGAVTAIVDAGPFRYSRNPMYLVLMVLYAGGTLAFQLGWAIVFAAPVFLALHFGVILPEERYLEATFGPDYREYARRVRRWM